MSASPKTREAEVRAEQAAWNEFVKTNPPLTKDGIRRTFMSAFHRGMHTKGAKPPPPQSPKTQGEQNLALQQKFEKARKYERLLSKRMKMIKDIHTKGDDGFCDECELEYPCKTIEISLGLEDVRHGK
jgi:hypothetical protein